MPFACMSSRRATATGKQDRFTTRLECRIYPKVNMQNTLTNVTHIQALWHIVQLLLATDVSSKQKIDNFVTDYIVKFNGTEKYFS